MEIRRNPVEPKRREIYESFTLLIASPFFLGEFFIYNVVKALLHGGALPSKLTNYLIVHCLFSPVAIHTFAEEELRLETSSKGIKALSSFLLVHCINLLKLLTKYRVSQVT